MNESERWVSLSALGAAMFAVGFACAGVACSTRDTNAIEGTLAQASASASANANANVNAIPSGSISTPSAPSAPTASNAPVHDGLKVKRLVVTSKISDREPSVGHAFKLGSAPVYAFVELENAADEARSIRLVFQNQDTQASVGHVKLTIPAGQARFRTWGNTRLIQDPGRWVAVVSTSDGIELGRAAFEVKG